MGSEAGMAWEGKIWVLFKWGWLVWCRKGRGSWVSRCRQSEESPLPEPELCVCATVGFYTWAGINSEKTQTKMNSWCEQAKSPVPGAHVSQALWGADVEKRQGGIFLLFQQFQRDVMKLWTTLKQPWYVKKTPSLLFVKKLVFRVLHGGSNDTSILQRCLFDDKLDNMIPVAGKRC